MKTGEVCYVDTIGGPQPAVFIRQNRTGKPVVRRLYFTLGNELSVYDTRPIEEAHDMRQKIQDVADAIAIVIDARK